MPTGTSPAGDDRPSQPAERNRLLRALKPTLYRRVLHECAAVELPARRALWPPGAPIRSVYFPRTCVASLIVPANHERAVEAATVGNEGFVGVSIALGVESTTIAAMVQVEGLALCIPAPVFRGFMTRDSGFRLAMLAYTHTLMEQTAQTVACNRRHELAQRCARWLLMTHDRVGAAVFVLTQDFLAIMLGVRRAGVSVAAGRLHRAGLIRYSRGRMEILDRGGLEAASCECYRIVTDSYARSVTKRRR